MQDQNKASDERILKAESITDSAQISIGLAQDKCNVCEMLICKLVYLFSVFGEHGRYICNINHLW